MQNRQIVLDTETTGLEVAQKHRVIEIGGIEIVNRRLSDRQFHRYLQPDRAIDPGAFAVHGISDESLIGQPRFAEIAEEFIRFVDGAELIIHNAPFDVAFLDYELSLLGRGYGTVADRCRVLDTLALARRLHPRKRNSLDALCERYNIDNSRRTLHGALLDAAILAEVYLAMTSGQVGLSLETGGPGLAVSGTPLQRRERRQGLTVLRADAAERDRHADYLKALEANGSCVWRTLETAP